MFAITRYIPNRKALKKSTFITNNTTSLASTSVFAGTNPYGGITIHRENMKQTGMDYEAFRLEVIRLLQDFKDERTGKRPFVWLKCREDVDHGPFLDIYPDILFELEESYGVNWALHTKITRVNTTHKKISGGHRYHGFYGITFMESYDAEKIAFFDTRNFREKKFRHRSHFCDADCGRNSFLWNYPVLSCCR